MSPDRKPALASENWPETPKGKGALIRSARDELGISQAVLSSMAEISQGYYGQLEKGEVPNPSYLNIIKIAGALGLHLEFWEEAPNHNSQFFLRPEAKTIFSMLSNGRIPETSVVNLLAAINNILPDEPEPLHYISYNKGSAKPINMAILQKRVDARFSQEALARRARLTQGYLSQLENGNVRNPSIVTIRKLERALGTSFSHELGLVAVTYPPKVTKLDQFFRSSQIDPGEKAALRGEIRNLLVILDPPDQFQGKLASAVLPHLPGKPHQAIPD